MTRPLTNAIRVTATSAARNTTWTADTFIRNYPGWDAAEIKRIFADERRAARPTCWTSPHSS